MALKVEMVTFDCTDAQALADWWAAQFGGKVHTLMPGEFFVVNFPEGPNLGFQQVDDPTPGKNRLHLDLYTTDQRAEVERLKGLGAAVVREPEPGDDFVVMADPDGNLFCVVDKSGG